MITETTFEEILSISQDQKDYLDSLLDNLSNMRFDQNIKLKGIVREATTRYKDLGMLISLLDSESKERINEELDELDLFYDNNGFLYFKFTKEQDNFIKLHIPLKDYWKDGILVANLIKNIDGINSLKLTLPVKYDFFDDLTPDYQRALKHIPLTIYLPRFYIQNSGAINLDDELFSVEKIAYIISQIDSVLEQIASMPKDIERNPYGQIELSDSIAESDVQIGRYTTLTLEGDRKNEYISAMSYYRETAKGVYTLVRNRADIAESLRGYEIRQRLIENSTEVDYLKKILPYAGIFNEIHEYVRYNELYIRDFSFFPDSAPGKLLLNNMRSIFVTNSDIEELDQLIDQHSSISNNETLMGIIEKFKLKYTELNEAETAHPSLR